MFLTKYTPSLYPSGANIDRIFDELFESTFKGSGVNKYPATDVYTENGVTHIEVAVTGFSENEIELSQENGILTISGSHEDKTENEDKEYHTRNIAKRSFIRKFNLLETVESVKATIENGILHIELVEKPKEQTKKVFKIEKK
jgi:molecular chaperone IbpA